MKPITQEDDLGCGVAVLAYLEGISYQEGLKFFEVQKVKEKGVLCREMVQAFAQRKKKYSYHYLKPKLKRKIYQEDTIVFIKRSKLYPFGHYFARKNGVWMDPWVNFRNEKMIKKAKGGLRKRLPGQAIYGLFRTEKSHCHTGTICNKVRA